MKKAFAKSIHKTGNRFYEYKEAVLTFKDPEDLHQMRVSGRTLLSYMYALADKSETDRPRYKKLHKPLKKAMASLGALRDTDVLLEEVEVKLDTFAPEQRSVIEKWLAHKKGEREALREQLEETLPATIDKNWKRRMATWASETVPKLVKRKSILIKLEELNDEKDRSFDAIRDFPSADMSDPKFLEQLHNARIRVKKLRYTLTVLSKFMEIDQGEIETMKTLQDQLGHIHDLSVWISQLRDFYGDNVDLDGIESTWRKEMQMTLRATGILI
jgi:CHAD domain-containing protein